MSLPQKNPLPAPSFPIADNAGRPAQSFWQYLGKLDALITALAGGAAPPLVNAVNDKAAAAAGVGIGEFYRNGSIVQVRMN